MGHDLSKLPNKLDEKTGVCRAVIETPKGRRGKYDYDPKSGLFRSAGDKNLADRQSRGTSFRSSLSPANRKVKNFCASRFIRMRAESSFISIKSGANP